MMNWYFYFVLADLCSASVCLCVTFSELTQLLTEGVKSSLQDFLCHFVSMSKNLSVIFRFQYCLFSVTYGSVGQTLLIGELNTE